MKKLCSFCIAMLLGLQVSVIPTAAQNVFEPEFEKTVSNKKSEALGNGVDQEKQFEDKTDENRQVVQSTKIEIEYDEHMPIGELMDILGREGGMNGSDYSNYSLYIAEQQPTSYRVDAGRVTGERDASVLVLSNEEKSYNFSVSGTLVSELLEAHAGFQSVGTGTALVCLISPDQNQKIMIQIEVCAAPLTLIFVAGQSNAEGATATQSENQRRYSVACPEGKVYSTYVPPDNLAASYNITGINFPESCSASNAEDFIPGALAGTSEELSVSGKPIDYKKNTLTATGKGKTGMDSALAYKWHMLTGDKVWIVNASWGASSITSWIPGEKLYERTEAVYDLAYNTYQAEIEAGHYVAGDQLLFWLQGEQDVYMDIEAYESHFAQMYQGFLKDYDYLDGIGVVMVRSSVESCMGEDELQMTAPRTVQYAAGRNKKYRKLYVVSNVNEQWLTDESVKSYFQNKYGSQINQKDYPIRQAIETPTSVADVHPNIHYYQIGHNENGFDAAASMYHILHHASSEEMVPNSVGWYDETGQRVYNYQNINKEDNVLFPIADPVYTGKQINITGYTGESYNSILGIIPKGEVVDGTLYACVGTEVMAEITVRVSDYLDFSDVLGKDYTGFYYDDQKAVWYYVDHGKVYFDKNGVVQGTVNGEEGWWYVSEGKVIFTDTVAQNAEGWWYIKNGKVDFNYTGLAPNSSGWWRIENGKVNFDYTGFVQNEEGWWYLEGGHVLFDRTEVIQGTVNGETAWWNVVGGVVEFTDTVAPNSSGWWCVRNGKVDFGYTGLASNSSGWWRIENGNVNFSYCGFVPNAEGWWYLEGGHILFDRTEVIQGTVNGETAWWNVVGGAVSFTDTVASNSNGWWRIENGKVNFSFYGIAQNEYGWWYIQNGCVDFGYSGDIVINNQTHQVVNGLVYM